MGLRPPLPPDPWTPFETTLMTAGTVVFFAAAIIELAFLVHYIVVAPAFRSAIGWMFVIRSFSFLVAGVLILLGRIWGPYYAARPYLTLTGYVLILISALLTYGTFLYERYARRDGAARPLHPVQSFARRALGLRERRAVQPCEERTDTRPLRIVGGTGT